MYCLLRARAWYIVILFRDVLCHVNWIITTVVQHNIPEPPVIAVHRTALIKKIVVLTCLCATVSMLSWLLQGTESKMPRDTIKTRTECPKGKKNAYWQLLVNVFSLYLPVIYLYLTVMVFFLTLIFKRLGNGVF